MQMKYSRLFVAVLWLVFTCKFAMARDDEHFAALCTLQKLVESQKAAVVQLLPRTRGGGSYSAVDLSKVVADPKTAVGIKSHYDGVFLMNVAVNNEMVEQVGRFGPAYVDFFQCDFQDGATIEFKTFKDVIELRMMRCRLSRREVHSLPAMPSIQHLDFGDTYLSTGQLKWSKVFANAEKIILARTGAGNRDLEDLAKCSKLQELNLQECPISDDGIKALIKHATLRKLTLYHTDATENARENLKGNTPKVEILGIP